MTTFTMVEKNYKNYQNISFNKSHSLKRIDFKDSILTKLFQLDKKIKKSYNTLTQYIVIENSVLSKKQLEEFSPVFQEILQENLRVHSQGIAAIDRMTSKIHDKEISAEDYEMLIKIINYQEKIMEAITSRELTLERLEIYLNHLKEAPTYMEHDLRIDNLPESKSSKHISISVDIKDNFILEEIYAGVEDEKYKKRVA